MAHMFLWLGTCKLAVGEPKSATCESNSVHHPDGEDELHLQYATRERRGSGCNQVVVSADALGE